MSGHIAWTNFTQAASDVIDNINRTIILSSLHSELQKTFHETDLDDDGLMQYSKDMRSFTRVSTLILFPIDNMLSLLQQS